MTKKSKLKIWTEECKTTGTDDDLYLRLIYHKSEDIGLVACDKNGEEIENGFILTFDLDFKTILKHQELSDDIDLLTDFRGSALVEDISKFKEFYNEISVRQAEEKFMEMMKKNSEQQYTSSTIN